MTLYRKYRPQQFKDLLGQEAVSTTLQQAIIRQRLGHAYLFSGPRGTGKTSAARIFARAAVCQDPKVKTTTVDACGKCESCTLLSQNQTTDLLEIDAASNRGVEDIRELRSQTGYRPMQLSKKIYIID
ncbi:hypothetical protein KGQ71_01370 [Patescibacteria group bacterium]|nr:hypothetical protein [Patescibacteria group bacterium]